ncbi:MAG: DUF2752 domain-containing protein [Butyrivibrio sp.]|uniref:DUF2752 domain-containing protein n=1 Tax=Butyrivibrio sp. TaxID=28121 RepID=UPI001B7A6BC7|nr:DUF2752 domain-containing protein [Butyrivibrio sp.]MBP3783981.1 DUF2752 domain-containing protein [Butyrivibrio sp.]
MKKIKDAILAILAVAFVYTIFYITKIGCPIKFLTGISCMGCGMTRAYLSLLHLDFGGAFRYHPLFPIPVIAAVIFLFRSRISQKIVKVLLFTTIVLFSIIYLLRILDPSDTVVVFEPANGAVVRGIHMIVEEIK